MSTTDAGRRFYARRVDARGDPTTASTSDASLDDDGFENVDDDWDDDYDRDDDLNVARGMTTTIKMIEELRTERARTGEMDARRRARLAEAETRRNRRAEETAREAIRADATRLRANAARAERRMEEATEAERQLRAQNGDLRRKLERCANENKRLVMELGRLKEKLATRRRTPTTFGAGANVTATSSAPDAHVSTEYHEAVMRGFDQKVAALIDEIESLRRVEPRPTTPAPNEQRRPLRTNDADDHRDDHRDDHQGDENARPPSPFSPNLAPLDALLDKLSAR